MFRAFSSTPGGSPPGDSHTWKEGIPYTIEMGEGEMSAFVIAVVLLLSLVFWRQVVGLLIVGAILLIVLGLVFVVETIQTT